MSSASSSSSDDDLEMVAALILAGEMDKSKGRSQLGRAQSNRKRWSRKLPREMDTFKYLHGSGHVDEDQFRVQMRMSRSSFEYFVRRLKGRLEPKEGAFRDDCWTTTQRLTYFLARVGSSTESSKVAFSYGVGRSSIDENLEKVALAILKEFQLEPDKPAIRLPTADKQNELMENMLQKRGMPCCWGSLDGKHFKIRGGADDKVGLSCRKGGRSINVGALCQMDGKFAHVCNMTGGTTHDSHFMRNNNLTKMIDANLLVHEESKCCIIGGVPITPSFTVDAAFPLTRNSLKPYPNPRSGSLAPEKAVFNKIQSSARQDIERCWGMLINRFLIFYSPLPFRGSDHLVRASKLIHACMVLHNILLQMNDPDFPDMRGYPDWFPEEEENVEEEKDAIRTPNLFEPMAVRDALAKYLGSMYTLTDGRRLVQKDDAEITELRFFPHKQLAEKIASL